MKKSLMVGCGEEEDDGREGVDELELDVDVWAERSTSEFDGDGGMEGPGEKVDVDGEGEIDSSGRPTEVEAEVEG